MEIADIALNNILLLWKTEVGTQYQMMTFCWSCWEIIIYLIKFIINEYKSL